MTSYQYKPDAPASALRTSRTRWRVGLVFTHDPVSSFLPLAISGEPEKEQASRLFYD